MKKRDKNLINVGKKRDQLDHARLTDSPTNCGLYQSLKCDPSLCSSSTLTDGQKSLCQAITNSQGQLGKLINIRDTLNQSLISFQNNINRENSYRGAAKIIVNVFNDFITLYTDCSELVSFKNTDFCKTINYNQDNGQCTGTPALLSKATLYDLLKNGEAAVKNFDTWSDLYFNNMENNLFDPSTDPGQQFAWALNILDIPNPFMNNATTPATSLCTGINNVDSSGTATGSPSFNFIDNIDKINTNITNILNSNIGIIGCDSTISAKCNAPTAELKPFCEAINNSQSQISQLSSYAILFNSYISTIKKNTTKAPTLCNETCLAAIQTLIDVFNNFITLYTDCSQRVVFNDSHFCTTIRWAPCTPLCSLEKANIYSILSQGPKAVVYNFSTWSTLYESNFQAMLFSTSSKQGTQFQTALKTLNVKNPFLDAEGNYLCTGIKNADSANGTAVFNFIDNITTIATSIYNILDDHTAIGPGCSVGKLDQLVCEGVVPDDNNVFIYPMASYLPANQLEFCKDYSKVSGINLFIPPQYLTNINESFFVNYPPIIQQGNKALTALLLNSTIPSSMTPEQVEQIDLNQLLSLDVMKYITLGEVVIFSKTTVTLNYLDLSKIPDNLNTLNMIETDNDPTLTGLVLEQADLQSLTPAPIQFKKLITSENFNQTLVTSSTTKPSAYDFTQFYIPSIYNDPDSSSNPIATPSNFEYVIELDLSKSTVVTSEILNKSRLPIKLEKLTLPGCSSINYSFDSSNRFAFPDTLTSITFADNTTTFAPAPFVKSTVTTFASIDDTLFQKMNFCNVAIFDFSQSQLTDISFDFTKTNISTLTIPSTLTSLNLKGMLPTNNTISVDLCSNTTISNITVDDNPGPNWSVKTNSTTIKASFQGWTVQSCQ